MTSQPMTAIAVGLVEQQRRVVKSLLETARVGNARAWRFIDRTWEKNLVERTPGLGARARTNLIAAERKLTRLARKNARTITVRLDRGIDVVLGAVAKNVSALNGHRGNGANRLLDNKWVRGLESMTRPAAELSLAIAKRTADGAEMLARRVSGRTHVVASRKKASPAGVVKKAAKRASVASRRRAKR